MKIHWLAAVILVALAMAGCGGGSGSDTTGGGSAEGTQAASAEEAGSSDGQSQGPRVDFRDSKGVVTMWVAMDGFDSAETVSFLVAEKRGYFRKEKIAPLTLSPVTPKLVIPDVVKGQDLIGVITGPEAVVARDKGAPIVIVGSVVQEATAALIWPRESNIETIADLKGKTIATPGLSSQESLLEHVLGEEGLEPADVNVIRVGNDLVASLEKGRADAIFGGSENVEGIDMKARGLQPVVHPVTAMGVPDYEELVLVAREDVAEANPKLIDDFVSATARGSSAAVEEPRQAARLLVASGEKNPEVSTAAMHQQVDATAGMLSSSGQVDPARLQQLIDWMSENEMIQEDLPADSLLASP